MAARHTGARLLTGGTRKKGMTLRTLPRTMCRPRVTRVAHNRGTVGRPKKCRRRAEAGFLGPRLRR